MKPALITFGGIAALGFLGVLALLALQGGVPVLFPAGSVGAAERDLMVHTVFLMLIVVVPVYALIAFVALRYRASNRRAGYAPDWEQSTMEEFIWWSIPFEIVLVLAALTWTATHDLDPQKPLASEAPPITVEVVALPWKWLFLYPEEGVASVNELALPAGRPVEFRITADAPMNSFWIPALGGQMYAMSGMATALHLDAPVPGTYQGLSANYSGDGFANMRFSVDALDADGFAAWVAHAKAAPETLTEPAYAALAEPSADPSVRYYGGMALTFEDIIMSSMHPDRALPLPAHQ